MDVSLLLQHSQYALPVGIVLVCAILVFVFGFKKAEQPPFAQLSVGSDVDRKFANKKRSKIKEKKSVNGQVTIEKPSPIKKSVSTKADAAKKAVSKPDDIEGKLKERKQEDNKISVTKKDKDQVVVKVGKENKVEQVKNKKNIKNLFQEKPVDFDEGDWEQAYSRKDKKNKKKEEESPSKKNKKNAKKADLINEEVTKQKVSEKTEIKDKVIKETENKELKEKEKKDVILTPISNEEISKEKEQQKEEQTKNEKVEKEEKKSGKSKKTKKVSESENTSVVTPPTSKVDNKVQEQRAKKKDENTKKDLDNSEEKSPKAIQTQEKTGPVFDELGDVWTEAKPQKKSKKKARKDN
ncbi:nucleolar protein 58-like [Bombus pyrosoma]|uniref:nucleolar protein 58-like n=1 Tax=Bombus pyrosoma TaxID=396416 RepID=UPI001CB94543|nr:nucleolar protein 58-like [Bombus pyrosoma]